MLLEHLFTFFWKTTLQQTFGTKKVFKFFGSFVEYHFKVNFVVLTSGTFWQSAIGKMAFKSPASFTSMAEAETAVVVFGAGKIECRNLNFAFSNWDKMVELKKIRVKIRG